jgi:hypothetical protein
VRRAPIAAVVLALILPACATRERPEGIVERWLLALNQGATGEPGSYAGGSISDEVLPDWEELEPGQLDLIEVGAAIPVEDAPPRGHIGEVHVPFRVVTVDGTETRGRAVLPQGVRASRVPIDSIEPRAIPPGIFPSENGPPIVETTPAAWFASVLIGAGLAALSWALMGLVRVNPSRIRRGASRVPTEGRR